MLGHLYTAIEALDEARRLGALLVVDAETGSMMSVEVTSSDIDGLKAKADELFSLVAQPHE